MFDRHSPAHGTAWALALLATTGCGFSAGDHESNDGARVVEQADGFAMGLSLSASSDSGLSNSDRITNVSQPTFTGSGPANARAQLMGACAGALANIAPFTIG